ncbi:MAG: hypothetical protein MJ052_01870 [Sphaerochaetaceae bacterium]|nr:hypothetical protein [Sphaerochaetaceae bacterium]
MKTDKKIYLSIIAILIVVSGILSVFLIQSNNRNQELQAQIITKDQMVYENLKGATAWQMSAEAQGLMLQAFEVAKNKLDDAIAKNGGTGDGLAIITDVDDTLVDGAHYTTDMMLGGKRDNVHFARFLMTDACNVLPGALDFLNYAKENGVEIFYVTNRSEKGYKSTDEGYQNKNGYDENWDSLTDDLGISMYDISLKQLKYLEFPYADEEHLIVNKPVKSSPKSKESARQSIIAKGFQIAMLLGDDINDFTDDFEKEAVTRAKQATDAPYKDKWGTEWIILPNAVYGSWYNAIAEKNYSSVFESNRYTDYPVLWDVFQSKHK